MGYDKKYWVLVQGNKIRCAGEDEQNKVYEQFKAVGQSPRRKTEDPELTRFTAEQLRDIYESTKKGGGKKASGDKQWGSYAIPGKPVKRSFMKKGKQKGRSAYLRPDSTNQREGRKETTK